MKRAWCWLLDKLGGFGIFFMSVFGIPMGVWLLLADIPGAPLIRRIEGAAFVWGFSLIMGVSKRNEDRRKERADRRRDAARTLVLQLREIDEKQRTVTDDALTAILKGLEPPV